MVSKFGDIIIGDVYISHEYLADSDHVIIYKVVNRNIYYLYTCHNHS